MAATMTFQYSVRDKAGKLVTGTIDADSQAAVAQKLTSMGYAPVSIAQANAGVKREIESRVHAIAQHSAWLREHPPRIEYFGWPPEPWIQAEQHAFMPALVEAFVAGEQQLADAIQRIGLAAAMAEGLVLHSAANLV